MSKTRVIIVLVIVIIFGFKAIRDALPISRSIDITEEYATIRYGNAFLKAKVRPKAREDFWVNNAFKDKRSDGWFWVIPMEQAKALKAAYGDFVHCDSPGASAAKESLQLMRVFTADPGMREKIKRVIASIKSSQGTPSIEIKGSKLEIEEYLIGTKEHYQSYHKKPENFIYIGPPEIYYLIEDIDIKNNNEI